MGFVFSFFVILVSLVPLNYFLYSSSALFNKLTKLQLWGAGGHVCWVLSFTSVCDSKILSHNIHLAYKGTRSTEVAWRIGTFTWTSIPSKSLSPIWQAKCSFIYQYLVGLLMKVDAWEFCYCCASAFLGVDKFKVS